MKFTCDSCNAQYMISDEKVGPTGVKVRCKKCGHVITVRRVGEGEAPAPAGAPAPEPSGDGLDAELGSAFDSAFGDRPAAPAPDLDATQAMSPEDAKRIADAPAPAPLSTEWYVAIGEAQVGPLPIADVKRKWEQGDVGPDSLVWRPGMGDWSPLSTVAELASVLSPIPRPAARTTSSPAMPAARTTPATGTPAAPAPAAPAPSNAAPDATWKPAGASALAALASEELQARAPQAAEPPKAAKPAGGAKSLVEQMNLADQGGVEPTGALPLSIKGVERTDERPVRRKSSVATRQEEIRQRRGSNRLVIGLAVALVAVVAAAGVGVKLFVLDKRGTEVAVAPAPTPPPAPPPAAPPAPPVAAAPAAPPATPPAAPAAAPAEPPPAPPAAVATAAEPAAAKPRAAPPKPARAAPAPPPARAVAKREEEPPPEPVRPAPKKKGDLLEGIGGGDDALAEALGGGGGSGRSVYVPPKPGGSAAALPDTVSDGQVTEGIKGKFDSLAECADKGAGGATIVMQWDISPEGGVRSVKCKAPCGDAAVGSCLASVIKNIRFARSAGGRTRVEFPFKF